MTWMTQSASSSSLVPMVNEEVILEQVLSTSQEHKTRVGRTLSQRVHPGISLSWSCSEGTSACVDQHVEEYLCQSYEQNLQIYESHRLMHQLLAQLHPNIQFPKITRLELYVPPGHSTPLVPPPLPDAVDDDASNAMNLGDSQLFQIFFLVFCLKLRFDFINEIK